LPVAARLHFVPAVVRCMAIAKLFTDNDLLPRE
jgi:hypothetical protein